MNGIFRTSCAVVLSGLVVAGAAGQAGQPEQPLDKQAVQDLNIAKSLSRAFNRVSESIAPSVVHITQYGQVNRMQGGWFGRSEPRLTQTGAGSGVIVSNDGYILTNHHVITGAENVRVKLNDGREFEAKVVGTDPATDLGVIKIEAGDLTAARFGDSEALAVGEWVIAVGSPFGIFDNTVTTGIVSAKGRTNLASQSDEKFEDYIQTDAAINPGNSGGPLVNLEGEVVGINSQIASRTGGSVGIGFSIPSTIARAVMDSIIRTGKVERGWLGVNMGPVRPQLTAAVRSEPRMQGALIEQVIDGSPADAAGLEAGDVVVRFNGRPIDSPNRFRNSIAFTPPGTDTELYVLRDGRSVRLNATIADTFEGRMMMPGGKGLRDFGFTVQTLPSQFVEQLGARAAVVNYIEPLSPAASELQVGDFIFMVDGKAVGSAEQFDQSVRQARGDRLRLSVQRGWSRGYVDVPRRE